MHTPISRRAALKASGIAICLPLLESMNPAIGRERITPPKRLVLICNALGLHPPSLFPTTTGHDYERTEYLEVLSEHHSEFTLISGLSHPDQQGKEPHDTEMTFLTAARNPGLGGFRNTISVDQYAAERLGHATRFQSISLSSNTSESQSYNSNGVMIPAEYRPSVVFEKLFLAGNLRQLRRQRQQLAEGQSILDAVADQTNALKRRASRSDQQQLDQYLDALRTAEVELTTAEAWLDKPKPVVDEKPPEDIADSANLIGRTRALLNLIPLILQTDSSRVISVMIQDHLTVPTIPGVSAEYHNLSHHGQDPSKIAQLKIIEMEILKSFSDFLSRMAAISAGDARLLDRTSILLGSNLGNANAHDPKNLPIILAGGGYQHGRYVAYDQNNNPPLCNLFVNLLDSIGIETDEFGTSTGTLDIS